MISCSRKLRNARNILQHEPAILARCFSKDTCGCGDRGDGLSSTKQPGHLLGKRDGGCNLPLGSTSGSTKSFSYSSQANDLGLLKTLWTEFKGDFPRAVTQMGIPMVVVGLNRASSCLEASARRCFSSDSDLPPHEEIGMPSLSPTMSEGNIARWLKKVGDKISPGEVLCEIETDKATVEMECMEDGYLAKILHDDGAKDIKVGEVIAITVEGEDDVAKFKDYRPSSGAPRLKEATGSSPPTKEESQPTSVASPALKTTKVDESGLEEDLVFASPLARKLAEDHNVPVSSIKGIGPDGRIVKADIEDYLGSKRTTPVSEYLDIPHSQIRKVTASRLVVSKQTIPHYYLTVDTCVDKLMNLRSQLNFVQEASGQKRVSVNDLVIKSTHVGLGLLANVLDLVCLFNADGCVRYFDPKVVFPKEGKQFAATAVIQAAALALRKVPQCNSAWMSDYIRQYHNVNINIAVQTDNGLFVPVIRDADKKGLSQIADEVKHLAQKAKDNCLKPEDYEGGTFTVSNLGGPFGIKQFSAIINPPQSAILAIGSAEKRVIPGIGPDQFEFASYMSIALSCDHRVIDGAIGAEYLKAFKGYIENPHSMLL